MILFSQYSHLFLLVHQFTEVEEIRLQLSHKHLLPWPEERAQNQSQQIKISECFNSGAQKEITLSTLILHSGEAQNPELQAAMKHPCEEVCLQEG